MKQIIFDGFTKAQAAAMLGALGGGSKSKRKTKASRKNGQRGGRPKKTVVKD